jgi:phenylacetate-coenzyme A ligase PaaK-like adenylate-forming protein
MHLNEETIHFEREWIDENRERFYPVITDFARRTQWFIRHRLTDILRIDPEPCHCGRRAQTLLGIEGRAEEALWLPDEMGKLSPVFPDVLRQALYSMPDPPAKYRIGQHDLRWEVRLDRGEPEAVLPALTRLVEGLRLRQPGIHFLPWTDSPA